MYQSPPPPPPPMSARHSMRYSAPPPPASAEVPPPPASAEVPPPPAFAEDPPPPAFAEEPTSVIDMVADVVRTVIVTTALAVTMLTAITMWLIDAYATSTVVCWLPIPRMCSVVAQSHILHPSLIWLVQGGLTVLQACFIHRLFSEHVLFFVTMLATAVNVLTTATVTSDWLTSWWGIGGIGSWVLGAAIAFIVSVGPEYLMVSATRDALLRYEGWFRRR